MKNRTREEIIEYVYDTYPELSEKGKADLCMQVYENQQIELAVDKALEIASENATMKYNCGHTKTDKQTKYHQVGADNLQIDKQSILSLRTQILNEIKDR